MSATRLKPKYADYITIDLHEVGFQVSVRRDGVWQKQVVADYATAREVVMDHLRPEWSYLGLIPV